MSFGNMNPFGGAGFVNDTSVIHHAEYSLILILDGGFFLCKMEKHKASLMTVQEQKTNNSTGSREQGVGFIC